MTRILIWPLLVLVLLVVAVLGLTALFACLGGVLSLLFPLSLFQCVFLALGSSFFLAFVFFAMSIGSQLAQCLSLLTLEEPDDAYEEDDFDDGYEGEEDGAEDAGDLAGDRTRPMPAGSEAPGIGRNAPCPCGSGRKYKRCCGK